MSISVTDLRDHRLAISNATIAYVSAERDLFQHWGPSAVRHQDTDDRRRLARLAHDLGWRRVKLHARIVTVTTLRRWWRELVQPRSQVRRGGRQPVAPETIALILDLARENCHGNDAWGRRRIHGELIKLGICVGETTIRRILQRHGLPPAPERGRSWVGPAAIAASDPGTVAIDFTKVTIGHGTSARHYFLLAGIHLGSREVELLGLAEHPNRAWIAQIARNLTMAGTGFLNRVNARAVLMDRDRLFTEQFRHMLDEAGFPPRRTPPGCPWCNGFIERFWQTLKNGILRKAIWLDEQALWQAATEFTHEHYLRERPHQGLSNRPLSPLPGPIPDISKPIVREDRLGGLIHVYRRAG